MKKLLSHIRIFPDTKRILTRIVFASALLLVVGAGVVLGGAEQVNAQSPDGTGTCYRPAPNPLDPNIPTDLTQRQCGLNPGYEWIPTGSTEPLPPTTAYQSCINDGGTHEECRLLSGAPSPSDPEAQLSAFQEEVWEYGCSIVNITGCFLRLLYWIFFTVPSVLLFISAYLFNVLIQYLIQDDLFRSAFVTDAWKITRDLSNIFFILILLYIAIKMILGLGGSEAKKMIARVIVVALLINFSLFFTRIVIDSSNILAQVFYNRINVVRIDSTGAPSAVPYDSARGEKELAGVMMNSFNPLRLMDQDFFTSFKNLQVAGEAPGADARVPVTVLIAMLVVTGLVLGYAAYAFFMSGFLFLNRLVELWMIMIFSPFAFMSSTVPYFSSLKLIGWEEWWKRLIKTSFVAPIFLLMLYFIFLLIQTNTVVNIATAGAGPISIILNVLFPAMVILMLLRYAVKYAEEGSGEIGAWALNAIKKPVKLVGGLALGGVALAGGAAIGATAVAGRAVVGRSGAAVANSGWAKKWETKGWGGEYVRRAASTVGSGSFDIRGVKIAGKDLSSVTGLKLGKAQEGGFVARREKQVEKRQKRAAELKVGKDEKLQQVVNRAEQDLQGLVNQTAKAFEEIERDLEAWRKKKSDAISGSAEEALAVREIKSLRDAKDDYEENTVVRGGDNDGKSMKEMKKEVIPDVKNAVLAENRRRQNVYADTTESGWGQLKDFLLSGGQHSFRGAREASNKIRREVEIKEKAA